MASFNDVPPRPATADDGAARVATPTVNVDLPFRRGGFASLASALDYAARGDTGLNFFDSRGGLQHVLSYRRLRDEARILAQRLAAAGLARGERIVLIAETSPDFCVAFFAAQLAGLVPVPVSTPVGLGSRASFIDQLRRQLAACNAAAVVGPAELAAYLHEAARDTGVRFAGTTDGLPEAAAVPLTLDPLASGEACYVQFSSGSTRMPQGVDIRQDQLMANIDASLAAQAIGPDDAGVSWLPFYHDMGLIGFVLAPLCAQRSIDLMSAQDFARRPLQWLALIARRRATITYSPSFGYELAVRRARKQAPATLDLSCLRLAGIGADMIQAAILERFAEAFAPHGFDRRAFFPSYGMAEVCVGLSFSEPFAGVRLDSFVDPQTGRARDFVLCGKVVAGHVVEIRDGGGGVLAERSIGRLFVRGPSVMPGYIDQAPGEDGPIRDGWLDTGDLGYWCDGQLVITGRAKELIIVNGRNVWPQDIEWAIEERHPGSPGDCCAFSIESDDTEKVIVLSEFRPDTMAEREALEGSIRQAVKETTGLESRVFLIGRRPGLPRTTSGKLARTAARARYLAGGYT